jgi:hypothetical protein
MRAEENIGHSAFVQDIADIVGEWNEPGLPLLLGVKVDIMFFSNFAIDLEQLRV